LFRNRFGTALHLLSAVIDLQPVVNRVRKIAICDGGPELGFVITCNFSYQIMDIDGITFASTFELLLLLLLLGLLLFVISFSYFFDASKV